jgi:hypothetical protein
MDRALIQEPYVSKGLQSFSGDHVMNRMELGQWAGRTFNHMLDSEGFDLLEEQRAGRIVVIPGQGMSKEFCATAFAELAKTVKAEKDPPRFGVGMIGSVWIQDHVIAGKMVRVCLDPSVARSQGRWGIMLQPMD